MLTSEPTRGEFDDLIAQILKIKIKIKCLYNCSIELGDTVAHVTNTLMRQRSHTPTSAAAAAAAGVMTDPTEPSIMFWHRTVIITTHSFFRWAPFTVGQARVSQLDSSVLSRLPYMNDTPIEFGHNLLAGWYPSADTNKNLKKKNTHTPNWMKMHCHSVNCVYQNDCKMFNILNL